MGRLTNLLAGGLPAPGYGYDVVGNLQSLHYASGVTNLCQYDARNRLTNSIWRSAAVALAVFAYTVAPTGNRTALAENVIGTTLAYNWAYDYLYRMTGERGGLGTVNCAFDAVGNRTRRQSTIPLIPANSAAYTANDWLPRDRYDANGNTTNSGTANYQYDALNHLTNAICNGTVLAITYDGDGNRVKKTVNGATTYYLVDDRNPSGYAQVLEEYQSLNSQPATLNRVYNYGLALISQRQAASGTVSYYGSDGHGSTRFLTDANGNVTETYTFDGFGLMIASSGAGTPNNYLYCGQQFDSDLGFYYLRARYYKPDSGRFWTMDTYEGNSEDPLSLHKYLYCQGNPVKMDDPTGHDASESAIAQMGVNFIQNIISRFTLPAISAARLSMMNRIAMIAAAGFTGYEATVVAKGIVRQWVAKAKQIFKKANPGVEVPKIVVIPEPLMPGVAAHIRAAQISRPDLVFLTRAPIGQAMKNRAKIMTGEVLRDTPLWQNPSCNWLDQLSWDEYLFASSSEGGNKANVSLWPVPIREQCLQGGFIIGSYIVEKIRPDDPFAVVVVP